MPIEPVKTPTEVERVVEAMFERTWAWGESCGGDCVGKDDSSDLKTQAEAAKDAVYELFGESPRLDVVRAGANEWRLEERDYGRDTWFLYVNGSTQRAATFFESEMLHACTCARAALADRPTTTE
jgi:hypothetical protein